MDSEHQRIAPTCLLVGCDKKVAKPGSVFLSYLMFRLSMLLHAGSRLKE